MSLYSLLGALYSLSGLCIVFEGVPRPLGGRTHPRAPRRRRRRCPKAVRAAPWQMLGTQRMQYRQLYASRQVGPEINIEAYTHMMCIYMHIHTCIYQYISPPIYLYVYTCIYMFTYNRYIDIYLYARIYTHIHIHSIISIHIVGTFIYIYIYIWYTSRRNILSTRY